MSLDALGSNTKRLLSENIAFIIKMYSTFDPVDNAQFSLPGINFILCNKQRPRKRRLPNFHNVVCQFQFTTVFPRKRPLDCHAIFSSVGSSAF